MSPLSRRLWGALSALSLVACSSFVSDDFTKGEGSTGGQGGTAATAGAGGSAAGGAPVEPAGAGGMPLDPPTTGAGGMAGMPGAACEPPAPLLCPPYCVGGCGDGICHIACKGERSCRGRDFLLCPAGYACDVVCEDKQACQEARITCPSCGVCTVTCTGEQACAQAEIACGEGGTCQKACDGKDACKDVGCSGDACTVQCIADGCKPMEVNCCARQCTVNGAPGKCR